MNRVLGRWIAALRMDCGLSRRSLAERLGVPASTVGRWESEGESIPAELLKPLAETLQVSAEDIDALQSRGSIGQHKPAATRARRPKKVLPYPVRGSLSEMLEMGGETAWALSAEAEARLGASTYQEVVRALPRDNALQLLIAHHVIALGAQVQSLVLEDLGCTFVITHRTKRASDGHRPRPVLVLRLTDGTIYMAGQVSIAVPGCPRIYRSDFLVLYDDDYGHRQWLDLTVDVASTTPDMHVDCPSVLGVPRFSFAEAQVQRADFGAAFVADLRRYMTSDVLHRRGLTTVRVRQPARLIAPALQPREDTTEH